MDNSHIPHECRDDQGVKGYSNGYVEMVDYEEMDDAHNTHVVHDEEPLSRSSDLIVAYPPSRIHFASQNEANAYTEGCHDRKIRDVRNNGGILPAPFTPAQEQDFIHRLYNAIVSTDGLNDASSHSAIVKQLRNQKFAPESIYGLCWKLLVCHPFIL